MIAFAARMDPDAREIRRRFEDEVESVVDRNQEIIADARAAVQGQTTYPDATFTARLSYGSVKGWMQDDRSVPPFTTIAGLYERATGRDPYQLPESWAAARDRLDLATPFDFVTTNDIVGGNSGSPVVNRDAELVGLVFDGNLPSLGGDFGFDPAVNRAVAVDTAAILEALAKVYRADRLVKELRAGAKRR
jgi:glutathione S-transferase